MKTPKKKKERPKQYEPKLKIKGTFDEVFKVAMQPKKKDEDKTDKP